MGNQPELDLNGLLQSYQQQAQQLAQHPPMAQSPYQGIGASILGMGGAIGSAMSWYGNSTATDATPEVYQAQPPVYQYKNPFNRLRRFFRINEEIQYNEGQLIYEPLDELRIKVATWLYN